MTVAFPRRPLRHVSFATAALLAGGLALAVPSQPAAQTYGEAERAEIELIVRDYLLRNPEIIVEAIEVLQSREQQAQLEQQRQALAALQSEVFDSPTSPTMGNPDGDVVLVEFFDYQCGFCKRVLDDVFELSESDGNIRVVFKELPILGPESVVAARAALAARPQGRYVELHNALMGYRGTLSEQVIFDIAADIGLDVDRLRSDMESPEVAAEIAANLQLAQRLGIGGTPAFVIGDQVVPGAIGLDRMRALVEAERAS